MVNKQKIVDRVSDVTRLPRKHVDEVINVFLDVIIEKLSLDEKINLSGFGIFEVKVRRGRIGANPRNPTERIQIPDVRVAKFRPGKTLKENVK